MKNIFDRNHSNNKSIFIVLCTAIVSIFSSWVLTTTIIHSDPVLDVEKIERLYAHELSSFIPKYDFLRYIFFTFLVCLLSFALIYAYRKYDRPRTSRMELLNAILLTVYLLGVFWFVGKLGVFNNGFYINNLSFFHCCVYIFYKQIIPLARACKNAKAGGRFRCADGFYSYIFCKIAVLP